jgi:hypothetical protein
MASLPFVQAPIEPEIRRCGNAQTGILEFPVLNGLTVGEGEIIEKLSDSQAGTLEVSARVAQTVARKEKITLTEAFGVIEKALSGQELEPAQEKLVERHSADIDELRMFFAQQGAKTQTATVTALIRCRLNLPKWDDMAHLPRALFNEIWAFAEEEIAAEGQGAVHVPTEEELKKPQVAPSNGKAPIGNQLVGI